MSTVYFENDKKHLEEILLKYSNEQIFLLFDTNTFAACKEELTKTFPQLNSAQSITIPSGETSKNLQNAENVWDQLLKYKATKKALLINIGGGVISDLGGFVAANYKRGIDFINIPTSSLAMIDACYGGKTAINLKHHKNQIGCFANPQAIYVDTTFLNSLPERHLKNGFIESIKHHLLFNKKALLEIRSIDAIQTHCSRAWIKQSLQYKIKVVTQDPLDKKERQALNFGHSIGHAIESLALEKGVELYHGEAVLLGMIEELKIAEKQIECPEEIRTTIEDFKSKFFPDLIFNFTKEALLPYLIQDKKNDNTLVFSLIKNVGEPQIFFKLSQQAFLNSDA